MRKKEVTFQESQKFGFSFILLTIVIAIPFICGFIRQIIIGKPWGNNPMGDITLIIVTLLVLSVAVAFFFAKMETIVNNEGIYVRIFPLQLKYKYFSWDEIEKAYIRKYRPLVEFGGWGIRAGFGTLGGEKGYNMSGNIGLQLVLLNGEKILIGTHKPMEMKEILRELGMLTE
ncbi:MAG: hypothetical protein LBO74_02870 [Candidatus Symbiothrix sp.]|jgi:hypothetical protein|nr:hypothetical protein [Candidatus Symbiothrix sp.]